MNSEEYAILSQLKVNLKKNMDALELLLSHYYKGDCDINRDEKEKCDVCGLSFILDGKCVNLVCDKNAKESK